MTDDSAEKRIVISLDESAKNKALQGINALQNAAKKLSGEGAKLGQGFKEAASGTKQLDSAQQSLNRNLKANEQHLQDQVRALANVEKQAKEASSALSTVQGGSGGSIGSNVGDIRGAISTVGGDAVAPALNIASGVGDAVEAFSTLNPAVLASTGAIAALSIVMNHFTAEAQKQADAINNIIDAQRAVNEAVVGGLTTEDAQARISELEELRAAEQALLDANTAAYEQALNAISDSASGALGGIAAPLLDTLGLTEAAVQQISAQEEALSSQINTSQGNIAAYNAEINALSRNLENGNIAANDTAAAEAELAETREQEAQRSIAAAEQAAARIAQLQQQQTDLINNRAIAEANANQVLALESRFAKEDEKAETEAHYDNLAAIRKAGNDKIKAIDSEIAAVPAQLAKALTDAANKGNQALSKLQSDYYASQQKAYQDFAIEQGRIASDTAKAAKRLAEDIADNLADAARGNDIVAFLKIQRDGQKELKRNAEDASEEEKRRTEDFARAREEERQAFQQRQAEILAGIAAERQRIQESFAERLSQLQQERAAEVANTQAALAAAQQRYAQQEALEAQQAARNAQRAALREQQENAAFQRQLSKIQSEIAGVGTVEGAFISSISRIAAAASNIAKSTAPSSSASGWQKSSSGGSYVSPYQSAGFQKSSSNNNVNIQMTVGDVATGQQVSAAINQAMNGVMGAIINGTAQAQG